MVAAVASLALAFVCDHYLLWNALAHTPVGKARCSQRSYARLGHRLVMEFVTTAFGMWRHLLSSACICLLACLVACVVFFLFTQAERERKVEVKGDESWPRRRHAEVVNELESMVV